MPLSGEAGLLLRVFSPRFLDRNRSSVRFHLHQGRPVHQGRDDAGAVSAAEAVCGEGVTGAEQVRGPHR